MNKYLEDCNNLFNKFKYNYYSNEDIIIEIDNYYNNYDENINKTKTNFINYMKLKYENDNHFKKRYELYGKNELENLIISNEILIIPERYKSDQEYYLYTKIKKIEKIIFILIIIIIINILI